MASIEEVESAEKVGGTEVGNGGEGGGGERLGVEGREEGLVNGSLGIDSAASSVYEGWNSLVSSFSKNLETLTVETQRAMGSTSGGTEKVIRSEMEKGETVMENGAAFFSDMLTSVTKSIQEIDTAAVRDNVNGLSNTVKNVISTAIENMETQYEEKGIQQNAKELLSNAKDFAREIPDVVFSQGEEPEQTFTGRDPVAPWNHLPEAEQSSADALREEMMKIVVDCIYSRQRRAELFEAGLAEENGFSFDFQKDGFIALGALNADENLKRFRAGLVPSHIQESVFWDNYFFHVDRLRRELRAGVLPLKSAPEEKQDTVTERETATEADTRTAAATKRNWDEEIDKIFDED